jgi:hypothetical protein
MSETNPSIIKPKKMVTRNVAIAIGIICIVLGAGLGSAMVYYTIKINDRDQIVNLTKSTLWVNNQTITQPEGSTTNWTFKADYAGYISVQVNNSTVPPLTEVVYNYQGVNYDQSVEGTTEAFPVMPSNIEIKVGNAPIDVGIINLTNGLPILFAENFTVSITYYY